MNFCHNFRMIVFTVRNADLNLENMIRFHTFCPRKTPKTSQLQKYFLWCYCVLVNLFL